MKTNSLGQLQRMDLREIWDSESGEFTPWLAQDENIALLGDTIGIELELEAQEKNVGPFRADILCKDISNDSWVLIENQLEATDHKHLGQLLTYAAGLKAVTIVWIAQKFTDEHRATMDWLNQITDENFNFFGLEVELWRIGGSLPAPKFNVVCKPNDWAKSVADSRKRIEEGELNEYRQTLIEYWAGFSDLAKTRSKLIKPQKPLPQQWTNVAIGTSNFCLLASVNNQKQFITAHLGIYGPHSKSNFKELFAEKHDAEKQFGCDLDWREMPDKKESKVLIKLDKTNPTDRNDWPRQHQWLLDNLEKLHKVFSKRVKALKHAKFNGSDDSDEGE
ncbi:MAG: DUF4268 domain-containing protein [Nitrospinae bacterium]|nr:DUF4268 domain-containing protein [Nitrospinota bacterium]